MAYKHAEILAQEVLQQEEKILGQKRQEFESAQKSVSEYQGIDAIERGKLELTRDEARRTFEKEDATYQTIKDVAERMVQSYTAGELIFANFKQGFDLLKRVYERSVIFAGTHEHVFTGLDAAYASKMVLHEATEVQAGMQQGAEKGIEALAEVSGQIHKKAVEVGYGKMIDASSLQKLADAVVNWQQEFITDVQAAREGATANAAECVKIYQDTQKKLADILTSLPTKTEATVPA